MKDMEERARATNRKGLSNAGSKNHHYIPQFYLKGFCRDDGEFEVFDKKYGKFKKAPQSPAVVFFEPRRNNIKYEGKTTDIIETNYSAIESSLANLFYLIQTGATSDRILVPDGIKLLKTHIAFQFWRLPRLDAFADDYLKGLTLEQVAHICTRTTPPMPIERIHNLLKNDEGFRKYARAFLLPLTTFDLSGTIPEKMEWSILDVEDPSKWANHLCTDAPFIFDDPQGLMHFTAPFIFPLTKARLLVARYRKETAISLAPIVSTKISVLSFVMANQYVVATERSYLEKIIEFSNQYIQMNRVLSLQREILSTLE